MKGAIFFSTKYGSTQEYAEWIADASGLPVFNMQDKNADPSKYDYLILGCPIIYYKIHSLKDWLNKNADKIKDKPVILFTVSGAPGGDKLNGWIARSEIPKDLMLAMKHFALRGRQVPAQLSWFDWTMLRIAGLFNRDAEARKDEMQGFDYMDKKSIEPIVKMVEQFQLSKELIAEKL